MDNLLFVGCGNMGAAMIKALLDNKIYPPEDLIIVEKKANSYTDDFANQGVIVLNNLQDTDADIKSAILAVKPQDASFVLSELSQRKNKMEVVISIMAGISITEIEASLNGAQIIRCMPNTPASIRSGMSVYCGNKKVKNSTYLAAQRIFESFGEAFQVDDEQMIDAATAISGSGPGYVFYFAEALKEGAIGLGFNEPQAELLASQTLLGAARLLNMSDDSAAELRSKVTSPGGTTEAALGHFKKKELKKILIDGFQEAFKRSLELANMEN